MPSKTTRKREPEELEELKGMAPPTKKQRENTSEPIVTRSKTVDGEVHATDPFLASKRFAN
jgi:hypothetical protein